eukprot:SAG31_NODE_24577_length_478_cov_1.350923_1_plen_46_part_10
MECSDVVVRRVVAHRVDDVHNTVDRQGRFRNIGRHDTLSTIDVFEH